jgi:hypothetical protein
VVKEYAVLGELRYTYFGQMPYKIISLGLGMVLEENKLAPILEVLSESAKNSLSQLLLDPEETTTFSQIAR